MCDDDDYDDDYDDWDYFDEDVKRLFEMVKSQYPEIEKISRIERSEVVKYHDEVDSSIRPICRIAIDYLGYPGIVDYFIVAVKLRDKFYFYHSIDW